MLSDTTILLFLLFLLAAKSVATMSLDYRWWRHHNVCKGLKNDLLPYFVFVNT